MERKFIVASFLDITGFRSWTYRASTAPEVKKKFIQDIYDVFQSYVMENTDVWCKYEGDGMMLIKEFTDEERLKQKPLFNFVKGACDLLKEVKTLIKKAETPPEGVRIRFIDGYVFKIMVIDPHDPNRVRVIPEYLEYCTNTARGLLEVNTNVPCIATKSLINKLGKFKKGFKIRKLGDPNRCPKGVNLEDLESLQVIKV